MASFNYNNNEKVNRLVEVMTKGSLAPAVEASGVSEFDHDRRIWEDIIKGSSASRASGLEREELGRRPLDNLGKKRVFVSFDYDHDKDTKELLVGQARNPFSPFGVIDFSLKEAQPEKDWKEKAETAIKRADVFIVILGSRTRFASGVLKEVKIAQKLEKEKFQIIGRPNGSASWAIPEAGCVYEWTWDNLEKLLRSDPVDYFTLGCLCYGRRGCDRSLSSSDVSVFDKVLDELSGNNL